MTAWLCEECIGIAEQHPGDEWLSVMSSCLWFGCIIPVDILLPNPRDLKYSLLGEIMFKLKVSITIPYFNYHSKLVSLLRHQSLKTCQLRWYLAEWHRKSEILPRYLSQDESQDMMDICDQCCYFYAVLSRKAIQEQALLFPSRPKLHVS